MADTFVGLLSAEAVIRVFALVAGLITVRSLGPAGFGAYSYALAFAGLVAVSADFGLSLLLVREVSAHPDDSSTLLGSTLVAVGLIGALSFAAAALLVVTGVITGPASSIALLIAFAAAAADAAGLAFEATLVGHGHSRVLPAIRAARGTVLVGGVVAAAATGAAPEGFLVVSLLGSLAGAGAAAGSCIRRAARPQLAGALRRVTALLRRAVPFALLGGSYLLYTRIDLVMLGLLAGRRAVGEYGAATRVLELVLLVPIYLGSAFLATVSQRIDGALATAPTPARVARAVRVSLIMGVPISFALAIAGPALLDLLAGSAYRGSGPLLVRLSPVVGLVACYAVLSNLQLARDRVGMLIGILALGALAKVVGDALLIPATGARGAATTAVGAEALLVAAQWIGARRLLRGSELRGWMVRFGGACAVLALVSIGLTVGVSAAWPVSLLGSLTAFGVVALWAGVTTVAEIAEAGRTLRVRWRPASEPAAP